MITVGFAPLAWFTSWTCGVVGGFWRILGRVDEDNNPSALVATVKAAALSATGPLGAMVDAVISFTSNRTSAVLAANFEAFVYETFAKDNERLQDVADEQERIQRLVEWLQQELEALGERLGILEASVLSQTLHSAVTEVSKVWVALDDPEMHQYLRAALRSMTLRRDMFRGSLASRLLKCVGSLKSDQVEVLHTIWKEDVNGGLTQQTLADSVGHYHPHYINTLIELGLIATNKDTIFNQGRASGRWTTALGHDLLRFVELMPVNEEFDPKPNKS